MTGNGRIQYKGKPQIDCMLQRLKNPRFGAMDGRNAYRQNGWTKPALRLGIADLAVMKEVVEAVVKDFGPVVKGV